MKKSGFWKQGSLIKGTGSFLKHDKNISSPDSSNPEDYFQKWDELEKEYYKDFDRRIANQADYQYKYKDKPPGKNQTENFVPESSEGIQMEKNQDQNTGVNGKPYREEALKVTDIRRGGHKRLTDLISTRFSKRLINRPLSDFSRGSKPLPETNPVDCPESGCQVCFATCCQCKQFGIWHEKDEGPMCYHEYKDLEERGHYDGTWEDHPENYTREEWQQYQEEKRNIEKVNREMELEKPELERLAKELQKDGQSTYEFFKNRFGDSDDYEEDDDDLDDDNLDDYDEEEYYR